MQCSSEPMTSSRTRSPWQKGCADHRWQSRSGGEQDTAALAETKRDSETKAAACEAAVHSRAEQLEALAKAKQVLTVKIGSAESLSCGFDQKFFSPAFSLLALFQLGL